MSEADPRPAIPDAGEDPPLDRTISPIAGRLGSGRRGKALALAGLLAGCAAFAFASWSADRPKPAKPPEQPAREVVAFEPARPPPTLDDPGPNPPSLTGGDAAYVPALEPDSAPSQLQSQPAAAGAGPTPRPAPLMAYVRPGDAPRFGDAGAGRIVAPDDAAPRTELEQLQRGSRIGRARARRLGDRSFLILAGTSLPCVLQTALDSSTPGLVSCVLPKDVYSDNGAVVLLEKGSRVLGEYRGGLRQGQRRIFVLWTRAVTPSGVVVDLASPAADALGRGGFDGAIDTHFWDRFGAAVLLSIVDEGAYAFASHGEAAGVTRLPSDAAAVAVRQGEDIAPTLRKPQGAEVSIVAAQDFDFSEVYGLKGRTP